MFTASRNPALTRLIGNYRYQAKLRDLEFSLSLEEFEKLVKQPCALCGQEPNQICTTNPRPRQCRRRSILQQSICYTGLDRIDNNIGYRTDNVIPCCRKCNWSKGTGSFEEFKEWVNKVYHHLF